MSHAISSLGTSYSALGALELPEDQTQVQPDIWDIFNDVTSPRTIDATLSLFNAVTSFCGSSTLAKAEAEPIANVVTTPMVPQAIAGIRDALSLSTVEIAKVFNVSRQAIYHWIEGNNVSELNRQRITEVQGVAELWQTRQLGRLGSLAREEVEGRSLLELLCAPDLDQVAIDSQLEAIATTLTQAEASRTVPTAQELLERHAMPPLSGQAYRRNLKASQPRRR
jgi:hypothetical protein